MDYEPSKIIFASSDTYVDYDRERFIVRVQSTRREAAQSYLRRVILEHKIGTIRAIFFRLVKEAVLVHLMVGEEVLRFLYPGRTRAKKARKRFTEIAKAAEEKLRLEQTKRKRAKRTQKITAKTPQPIPAEPNEWTADAVLSDILKEEE